MGTNGPVVFKSFLIGFCFFLGCMAQLAKIAPETVLLKNYEIAETKQVSVGESIIGVEKGLDYPTYTVDFDYQPPKIPRLSRYQIANPPLVQGTEFSALGRMADGGIVLANDEFMRGWGIHIQPSGHIQKGWIEIVSLYFYETDVDWTSDKLFSSTSKIGEEGGFRAEIMYSGVSGNTLKALYREYIDDWARPAYAQELQYDLSESKTIAFRSIRIEVIEATNSYLKYRVVSDDDLPWMTR